MAEHNNTGYRGEELAARYLEAKGYGIMARNWRVGHRDIDIVAHKGGTVAFVEVKTRRTGAIMEPERAVDARKVRSIAIAANAFLQRYGIDADVRFDIVSVTMTPGGECKIDHTEGAFVPQLT